MLPIMELIMHHHHHSHYRHNYRRENIVINRHTGRQYPHHGFWYWFGYLFIGLPLSVGLLPLKILVGITKYVFGHKKP
jgi:hypothetical protein